MKYGGDDSEVLIQVRGLKKSFGGRPVLQGVDLDIRRRETVVLVGTSGCGKSTILRSIIGASGYEPDEGSVKIFGREVVGMPPEELNEIRKRLGVLFQNGALYTSMTVGDNVALPLREHSELDGNIIDIIVKMKLELVGLRDFGHLMPSQLSGGMQKRVALARATALDPEVVFYDEPTTGLDPIMAGVVNKLIMDLKEKVGVTSFVITQDMKCALKVADRVVLLKDGMIYRECALGELRDSDDPVIRQFVDGLPDGPIPLKMSSSDYEGDLVGMARTTSGRLRKVE